MHRPDLDRRQLPVEGLGTGRVGCFALERDRVGAIERDDGLHGDGHPVRARDARLLVGGVRGVHEIAEVGGGGGQDVLRFRLGLDEVAPCGKRGRVARFSGVWNGRFLSPAWYPSTDQTSDGPVGPGGPCCPGCPCGPVWLQVSAFSELEQVCVLSVSMTRSAPWFFW